MRIASRQQNYQSSYDLARRILMEEMGMNWTCDKPEAQQTTATVVVQQPQNNDISYIGQLTNELKSKLDSIYQLSANTNEWTRETISTLIEVSNTLDSKLSSLNYAAMNTAQETGQQVIIGGQANLGGY